MNNLRYIIGGLLLGGALGAKTGEYLSTLMGQPNTFRWIEAALLLGAIIGVLLTLAVLSVVAKPSEKEDYEFVRRNEKSSVGTA